MKTLDINITDMAGIITSLISEALHIAVVLMPKNAWIKLWLKQILRVY